MASAALPFINPHVPTTRVLWGASINGCEQAGQTLQPDKDLKCWLMADCRFPGPHQCVTQDSPQVGDGVVVGYVSKDRAWLFIQPRYLMGEKSLVTCQLPSLQTLPEG